MIKRVLVHHVGRRAEAVAGWGSINTHVYVDQRGFKGYCNSFREEPKSGKYNGIPEPALVLPSLS